MRPLVERLRTDFTQKTLGELVQVREAASREIDRLTQELAKCRPVSASRHRHELAPPALPRLKPNLEGGRGWEARELLRLKDVCEIVGLARSTIYLAVANSNFPRPIHVGARAVRWRSRDIDAWLASKRA